MSDEAQLPTLASPRLRLRWLEAADLPALYAVFSDPDVTRYWSWVAWTDAAQADELLRDIRSCFMRGDLHQWGIALEATDEVIGTATLHQISREHRRAELGFALGSRWWGAGYATEAVTRLLAHAFGDLGLARIEADVDPRNARSLALLERLGFVREGYLRERWRVGGEVQDAVLLGLLHPAWQARCRERGTGHGG